MNVVRGFDGVLSSGEGDPVSPIVNSIGFIDPVQLRKSALLLRWISPMGLTDFESNTSNDYACEFTVAKELTKIPAHKSVSYMKVLDEKQILEISGWAEFPDRQASFACMCYVLNTMQKLLKSPATALVSAILCFVLALLLLTELGIRWHDNYEYYGKYPALFLLPPVMGLFLPWLLAWSLRKRKSHKDS